MKKLSLINKIIYLLNSFLATILLLSYLLPYVSPKNIPTFAILSLLVPPLIILNIFFVIYWILNLKKHFLLSTIILGITPEVGSKILSKLNFSKNKKIISLISTINLANLKKLTKNKNIVRATPLPPIEIKKGPIVICPPNKLVKN